MGDIAVNAFSLLNYVASASRRPYSSAPPTACSSVRALLGAKNADDPRDVISAQERSSISRAASSHVLPAVPRRRPDFQAVQRRRCIINYTMRAMPEFAWCFCARRHQHRHLRLFLLHETAPRKRCLNVFRGFHLQRAVSLSAADGVQGKHRVLHLRNSGTAHGDPRDSDPSARSERKASSSR